MTPSPFLSKHRIEAMTDGIYAVAMTLLVMELKLVNPETIKSHGALIAAVTNLTPKFIAWVISFFVLALFWLGNHRLFQLVRHVDDRLLKLCILQLSAVSLMPFASMLSGEFVKTLFAQFIYSAVMIYLSVCALLVTRHIYRHAEICSEVMPRGTYVSSCFRLWCLIVISLIAILIASFVPGMGNMAFILMVAVGNISARIEKKINNDNANGILSV
jgi:uncharacterized membrane protein